MTDDLVKRVEDEARAHYSGTPSMRRCVADLLADVQVELAAQAARIERLEAAMARIHEIAQTADAAPICMAEIKEVIAIASGSFGVEMKS